VGGSFLLLRTKVVFAVDVSLDPEGRSMYIRETMNVIERRRPPTLVWQRLAGI